MAINKVIYKQLLLVCILTFLSACTASQMQIEPATLYQKPSTDIEKAGSEKSQKAAFPVKEAQAGGVTPEYTASTTKNVSNQILVITKKGQKPFKLKDNQLTLKKHTKLEEFSITVVLLSFKHNKVSENALAKKISDLKKERPDLTIQPNYIYYLDGKENSKHRRIPQYALKMTGLISTSNTAGKGIRIGLIDTPVDSEHSVLKGATIKRFDYVQSRGKRHGTAIAGILVGQGRIQGVSPAAELISIGAFNEPHNTRSLGLSTSFVLGKSFNRALKEKVDVLNLSFGSTERDPLMNMLAKETLGRNIIMLASVGNDNHQTSVRYPAAIKGVYAITAIDARSTIYKRANTGNPVDYALPGVGILTTKPNEKYTSVTGTSFANAYATGIFALQLSQNRGIKTLDKKVLDLGKSGKDNYFGLGLMRY